jgi:excisionase family DNA binding protein
MKLIERTPEILTPEQAAEYLQVDRETIYRYIRQGKLVASNLGRTYRIPKRSLDLLLWATRTRQDVTLREYTGQQIEEFIRTDQMDKEAGEIAQRFTKAIRRRSARGLDKTAGLSQSV